MIHFKGRLTTLFIIILMCINSVSVFALESEANVQYEISDVQYPKTPKELIIKSNILNEMEEKNTLIDIQSYELNEVEAQKLFEEVISENDSIVSAEIKFDFVIQDNIVSQVNVIYPQDELMLMASSEFEAEVRNILACVDDSMTDLEKALAVHDYFVLNYKYDYTYSNYSKEKIFTEKKGVCAAYTDAYEYIMQDKLGVPCVYVSSDSMNHAWNLIKIDGNWYHVDCTWDDSYRCQHLHFLVSDSAMADDEREHYDWESPYKATSTKYDNYFWKYIDSRIILIDGYYYYITSEGDICKRNVTSGKTSTIYSLYTSWPCYNKPGWHWRGNYSGFEYCNDMLYANTNSKIISMNLSGNNVKTVVSQDTDEGYIYGFVLKGNKLVYDISRDVHEFEVESQKSIIIRHILGDITCDGNVNRSDLLRFAKYFSGWDVEMDDEATDINGDGNVNRMDLLRLAKYFAGWEVQLGK